MWNRVETWTRMSSIRSCRIFPYRESCVSSQKAMDELK